MVFTDSGMKVFGWGNRESQAPAADSFLSTRSMLQSRLGSLEPISRDPTQGQVSKHWGTRARMNMSTGFYHFGTCTWVLFSPTLDRTWNSDFTILCTVVEVFIQHYTRHTTCDSSVLWEDCLNTNSIFPASCSFLLVFFILLDRTR